MIDAKQFYEDYVSLVTDQYWDVYHDNSQWTACVTKLLRELIEKYGFTSQTEYFRIDVTGWVSHWEDIAAEAAELGLRPHLWNLKVAVEHENDSSDWTDELVKLTHIRCPLKVIIGYTPCDMRKSGGLEDRRLSFAARLLRGVDALDPASKEQYLVILGNSAPKHSSSPKYTDYGYRGYFYDYEAGHFMQF